MYERKKISIKNNEIKHTEIINYKFDNDNKYPFLVIGRGSYIGDVTIDSSITVNKYCFDEGVHNVQIGQFCSLSYNLFFTINRNHFYKNVTIADTNIIPIENVFNIKKKGQILIQNDVWIGHHVSIMNGVTIHNGAVVAANSNVVEDVPPYAIVGGNPAKVIGYRFSDDIIKKLLKIQWWDWSNEKIVENNKYFNSDINTFVDHFYCENEEEASIQDEILKKENSYLLFLDFEDNYCLWDKIICEFVKSFKDDNNASLILYLDKSFKDNNEDIFNNFNKYICNQLDVNNSKCNVELSLGENLDDEKEMFKKVNYYITDRSKETVRRSCYADDNNVKIISGVDIPVFDKFADIVNKYNNNLSYSHYLAIGNSITKHPKVEFWFGEWGMAASKKEKDYVHIVCNELRKRNSNFKYNAINFVDWERSENRDKELNKLDKYLADDIDLVTVFLGENILGENITQTNTIRRDYINLLLYINDKCPKARIILIGMFWSNEIIDNVKKSVAADLNIEYINLSDKYYNSFYTSSVNNVVYGDDNSKHIITNPDVARHPGDLGMIAIANEIIKRI